MNLTSSNWKASLCHECLKYQSRDFAGDPVSKIPRSQSRRPGFDPWTGN